MREYGMPARIRTDNGAPFAGTGLLGLSKLSRSWTKMGTHGERNHTPKTKLKQPIAAKNVANGSKLPETGLFEQLLGPS
jgi:hypothetical protein